MDRFSSHGTVVFFTQKSETCFRCDKSPLLCITVDQHREQFKRESNGER